MKYLKNKSMEFLDIDDENMVVYDSNSGDMHYISETGKSILSILDTETDFDELIINLCGMYSADKSDIESDVREFLDDLVIKKVVLAL